MPSRELRISCFSRPSPHFDHLYEGTEPSDKEEASLVIDVEDYNIQQQSLLAYSTELTGIALVGASRLPSAQRSQPTRIASDESSRFESGTKKPPKFLSIQRESPSSEEAKVAAHTNPLKEAFTSDKVTVLPQLYHRKRWLFGPPRNGCGHLRSFPSHRRPLFWRSRCKPDMPDIQSILQQRLMLSQIRLH